MAWSDTYQDKLAGVDPALVEILNAAAASSGINFGVSEGLRDKARQAEMVKQGKSQTMNSKHLSGNAVDVHILNEDGTPNWDFEAYRPLADAAKSAAAELGYEDFVWGGDWETLKDGVHFQYGRGSGGSGGSGRRGTHHAGVEDVWSQKREEEEEEKTYRSFLDVGKGGVQDRSRFENAFGKALGLQKGGARDKLLAGLGMDNDTANRLGGAFAGLGQGLSTMRF